MSVACWQHRANYSKTKVSKTISICETTNEEDAGLLQSIRYTQSAFHIQFPLR